MTIFEQPSFWPWAPPHLGHSQGRKKYANKISQSEMSIKIRIQRCMAWPYSDNFHFWDPGPNWRLGPLSIWATSKGQK